MRKSPRLAIFTWFLCQLNLIQVVKFKFRKNSKNSLISSLSTLNNKECDHPKYFGRYNHLSATRWPLMGGYNYWNSDFIFLLLQIYSISCNDIGYNVKYCDYLPGPWPWELLSPRWKKFISLFMTSRWKESMPLIVWIRN